MFHLALHFFIPVLIVWRFFKDSWKKSYLLIMSAMVIDLDHLVADPIYDPDRCSIGFHPLHEPHLMLIYAFLLIPNNTRLFGIGLFIHLILDFGDCLM